MQEPSPDQDAANAVPPVIEARRNLLSILPRILASLTVLWKAITISESKREASGHDQPCWTLGIPKVCSVISLIIHKLWLEKIFMALCKTAVTQVR